MIKKEGRGFRIPRKAAAGILANHKVSCEMIEREEGKRAGVILPWPKKKTRWMAGTCEICKEHMDVITNHHAQLHGYKNADALIEAGKVRFD